jgi:hypothetical protein
MWNLTVILVNVNKALGQVVTLVIDNQHIDFWLGKVSYPE